MDQITVVYNESGDSKDSSSKAYKQAENTLAVPLDSGVNQIKVAQGMTQEALASLSRALSLPTTAPQAAPPSLASAPVAPTRGQTLIGKRACFKCGSEDHIAANCPKRIDWNARKQVVSKAVALMMDEFEKEDTQHIPANFTGVTIPGHAFQLLQQADAPDLPEQLSAFTAAMLNYAHAHPQDACAQAYAALARCKGDAMVDELLTHDSPLFERDLAEVRMRSARTQTVEGGNVAVSLQPSMSDMLSTLVNLLDWLRNSEIFCRNLLELCIEISMDKGWRLDFNVIMRALREGQRTRKYGEYAADVRAQTRLHQLEQARVSQERLKRDAEHLDSEMQTEDSTADQGGVQKVFTTHARHEVRMRADVDYTALAGAPTAHEYMSIIVTQGGKRFKVKAIRDTGSPDTIISSKLAEMLQLKIEPTNETFGVQGNVSGKYMGMVDATLILTERISISQRHYAGNDRTPILLLGNDIFNKDKVVIMGSAYDVEVHTIALCDQMDVLPFKLMTNTESASEKASTLMTPSKTPVTPASPARYCSSASTSALSFEEVAQMMVKQARMKQGVTGLISSATGDMAQSTTDAKVDQRARQFVASAFLEMQ